MSDCVNERVIYDLSTKGGWVWGHPRFAGDVYVGRRDMRSYLATAYIQSCIFIRVVRNDFLRSDISSGFCIFGLAFCYSN